jgi:hypothetical protein
MMFYNGTPMLEEADLVPIHYYQILLRMIHLQEVEADLMLQK